MRLRLIGSVLAVAALGVLDGAEGAHAQNRLALVIGINEYQNIFSLEKAVGDAQAIQTTLQGLHFRVSTLFNANRRSFNAAISAFSARIQPGDIVLVHYSGHGVQLDGENFLLPADVPSPSAVDKEFLKSEAIALSVLIERIKTAGARTAVFIVDLPQQSLRLGNDAGCGRHARAGCGCPAQGDLRHVLGRPGAIGARPSLR